MLLTTIPVLATPDFKKPFIIHVDTSDVGVGAILIQKDVHKLEHLIFTFQKSSMGLKRITAPARRRHWD